MYIYIIDVLKKLDWNVKFFIEYIVRKFVLILFKVLLKFFFLRRFIFEIINIGVVKYI